MATQTRIKDQFTTGSVSNVQGRTADTAGGTWTEVEVIDGAGPAMSGRVSPSGFAYSAGGAFGARNGTTVGADEFDVIARFDKPNGAGPMLRLSVGGNATGAGAYVALLHSFAEEARIYRNSPSFSNLGSHVQAAAHTQPDGVSDYKLTRRNVAGEAVITLTRWNGAAWVTVVSFVDETPVASAGGFAMFGFAGSNASEGSLLDFEVTAEMPDGPVITGPTTFNLAENDTASGPLFSTDIGLGVGFPTKGGADAALFDLVGVGANQWRFVKIVGGDFEAPDDAGANRVYDLVFNASSAVSAAVAITLTNVIEPPGTPTIGTATAGNATVTINGSPPAANGSPSVTGYLAALSPGALTKTGATLPITFTGADGVVNGTTYTGTLRAINSDDTGPASASSNSVTPSTGATATAVTVTPPTPSSGPVGVASGAFVVGLNGTLGSGVTRVVTPSAGGGGGSFSPASVSLTDAQPTRTFSYTPASQGAKSITVTNDGALSNPAAVTYTATAPVVTYSATVGPFGANTGAGQRAPGTAFEALVFAPGYVIGDAAPPAPARVTGALNPSGLAVLTGLAAAGQGEAWFMFPDDPQPSKADRGTARARYTAS